MVNAVEGAAGQPEGTGAARPVLVRGDVDAASSPAARNAICRPLLRWEPQAQAATRRLPTHRCPISFNRSRGRGAMIGRVREMVWSDAGRLAANQHEPSRLHRPT